MPAYAPSDMISVNIPAEGDRGCGEIHARETGPDGYPVQPWRIDCPQCSSWLLANDNRWSATVEDISETYDEKRARENFEKRGVRDRDALVALAMARMAGLSQAEIPPSIAKALTGLPAHVPGVTLCVAGHDNTPGSRYCRECGAAMSRRAPGGELPSAGAA